MTKILEVKKLTKCFNGFTALNNIDFTILKPGIHGLLGTNGAGKTTLMGIILGLIKPTFGDIIIFNKNLRNYSYEVLRFVNFTSPYLDLPKKLTVMENLQFFARLYGVNNFKNTINELAYELKIEELLKKNLDLYQLVKKQKLDCANP